MSVGDFEYFCDLIKDRSGIVLSPEKAYLVDNRLAPIARQYEHADVPELLRAIRTSRDEKLLREVTDALTTNESFFFRDKKPFDAFREVMLPHILETRASRRRLRIWCAACSSGQEPYSLAMILKDMGAAFDGWKIEIVATDISHAILDRAKEGVFSQFEVQRGLPAKMLIQNFEKHGDNWGIKPDIKSKIDFRFFNLLDNPRSLGVFDIVFCRNVLIYFDQSTKQTVLESIVSASEKDAFLVLGAAETMIGLTNAYERHPDRQGLYQIQHPKEAAA
ncbi:MAG: protein-glutamate O-methyltransferase CheR [Rhodospirillaceae bacterium]|jgi:chemotaxis protein methyltransferase CheR|nr:protein-glutamate O-methyltransferase CheR [Rhodospirillaceae bacterium]MBT5357167.1 protein-glutamate O-methyltransferase CheR [Rhodospirillaceae bacterium]MBT5770377.1 protein-glutamate O-methyltransferase CheR [Rhodospirillaceae bacterium]MBT6310990.1 protein-glutamate O-methyltransferase CheR [Rhodospirillaceae bacterium]